MSCLIKTVQPVSKYDTSFAVMSCLTIILLLGDCLSSREVLYILVEQAPVFFIYIPLKQPALLFSMLQSL